MKIRNLILDLGGVLVAVDADKTLDAFRRLGAKHMDALYNFHSQDPLIDRYESGEVSSAEFRNGLRRKLGIRAADEEIDSAWRAMLVGIDSHVHHSLSLLAACFSLFTFSNTNEIHLSALYQMEGRSFPKDKLFVPCKKEYYSHIIGLRKPDPASYKCIIDENELDPRATLFVDDKPQHLRGASAAGLFTFHFTGNNSLSDLLIFGWGHLKKPRFVTKMQYPSRLRRPKAKTGMLKEKTSSAEGRDKKAE